MRNVKTQDDVAYVPASTAYPVQVKCPGCVNVEVRQFFGPLVKVTRLINDGFDVFSGAIDTTYHAPAPGADPDTAWNYEAPQTLMISAWNSAPGTAFTVALSATFDIWPHTGHWYPFRTPKGAAGMKPIVLPGETDGFGGDRFGGLSAAACKPLTGTWPNCAKPTAGDIDPKTGRGFLYYENKAGGGDFGDAWFGHTDDQAIDDCGIAGGPLTAHNPFLVVPGFLRISAIYCPSAPDKYGYNRPWIGGLLSTAFPDASTNWPSMKGGGYCEARMKLADSGASWNQNASGGDWVTALWMLHRPSITNGSPWNKEVDDGELYSADIRIVNDNLHNYNQAGANAAIFRGIPANPQELSLEFHRYGVSWNSKTITAWFDDANEGSLPQTLMGDGSAFDPFLLFNVAQGGGWTSRVPPSGRFDSWWDYVKCYQL